MKSLEQLAKEERNEYFRKYRAANKSKIQKHQRDYWMRKAEQKLREQEGGENGKEMD